MTNKTLHERLNDFAKEAKIECGRTNDALRNEFCEGAASAFSIAARIARVRSATSGRLECQLMVDGWSCSGDPGHDPPCVPCVLPADFIPSIRCEEEPIPNTSEPIDLDQDHRHRLEALYRKDVEEQVSSYRKMNPISAYILFSGLAVLCGLAMLHGFTMDNNNCNL